MLTNGTLSEMHCNSMRQVMDPHISLACSGRPQGFVLELAVTGFGWCYGLSWVFLVRAPAAWNLLRHGARSGTRVR